MMTLTFGEQVKIVLSRKNMTIKQLAELIEAHTGSKMSRQNLTQRLGRDNFQEQDMRMIAEILGCSFQLSILDDETVPIKKPAKKEELPIQIIETTDDKEQDITIGELQDILENPLHLGEELKPSVYEEEITASEDEADHIISAPMEKEPVSTHEEKVPVFTEEEPVQEEAIPENSTISEKEAVKEPVKEDARVKRSIRDKHEDVEAPKKETKPQEILGDINPYTGKEYQSNSVRVHPKRIGYVQVYDQDSHKWTDMTEWAFLGYQERKKVLLGKEYEPPIYLD